MGETRRSKAGYDSTLGLVALGLRELWSDIAREPVPPRFLDLIKQLEKAAASVKVEVLDELLTTSEPTAKTRALLEALRATTKRMSCH